MNDYIISILFVGGLILLFYLNANHKSCARCGKHGWKSEMKRTMRKVGPRGRYTSGWIINYYHSNCYKEHKAEEKREQKILREEQKADVRRSKRRSKWVKRHLNVDSWRKVPDQLPEPVVTSMTRVRLENGLYFFCKEHIIMEAIKYGDIEVQDFIKQYKNQEEIAYRQKVWTKLSEDAKRWFVWRMWHGRPPLLSYEFQHLSQYQ